MKPSRYNYFIPYKIGTYLIFSGITKKFLILNDADYHRIKKVIIEENYHNTKLCDDLYSAGFLVKDDFDEYKFIEAKFNEERNKNQYLLSVLPTYQCNFACWYCVQRHINGSMSRKIIEQIKKHIEKYLLENNITFFEIAWFGGEPLLNFDCIEEISSFAQNFCNRNNIEYISSITTNGYLITDAILHRMKYLKFASFQVTIDGDAAQHNLIRNDSETPSFDIILNNVVKILSYLPNVNFTLRFNYTNKNIENTQIVEDVNSHIPSNYRKRVGILLRKVWQIDESLISINSLNAIRNDFRKYGYNVLEIDILNSFESCYAEDIHFNTIFHDGRVDKCGNMDLGDLGGILDDAGNIIWKTEPIYYKKTIFTTNSPCRNCKYLPICLGPCPASREKIFKNGQQLQCIIENPKTHEESIITYCDFYLSKLLHRK
jgi:uncharacterized protein